MSPRSKKEYRETIFLRYKKASREQKTRILDEFCATCHGHRKHAVWVLRTVKRFTKPKQKGVEKRTHSSWLRYDKVLNRDIMERSTLTNYSHRTRSSSYFFEASLSGIRRAETHKMDTLSTF